MAPRPDPAFPDSVTAVDALPGTVNEKVPVPLAATVLERPGWEGRPPGGPVDTRTIQHRLDDEAGLIARLRSDPADPIAGDQLHALRMHRGDHEAAVELQLDRAPTTDDTNHRAELLVRAAHLYRSELNDLESARMVLITALGETPADRQIHDELDAVVCASGEFASARAAFADAAIAAERHDRGLAGELWLRVASLHIMERAAPAAICAALGRIEELSEDRGAAILRLCERIASDVVVLDALMSLHQRLGNDEAAGRVLARSLEYASDANDRARRHHAIAEIAGRRGEEQEREWHLAEALRLAPDRAATRALLADVYRRRGESRRAARILEEARAVSPNQVDRVKLTCQAAAIYADDLSEHSHAVHLYQSVIAQEPDHIEAAVPVAERYWKRKSYAELEPLIETLVRRALASGEPPGTAELCYRAGRTALELGKAERARGHLRIALRLEPGHMEALRTAAAAATAVNRHDEAYEALTSLLDIQERLASTDAELADTLADIGAIAVKLDDADAALNLYRAALDRCPSHGPALAGASTLLRASGDLPALAELLAHAAEASHGEARVRAIAELARLHVRGLDDPAGAIELYRAALKLAPNDHDVLTSLAEIYAAAEAWRDAVDVLSRLAELEAPGVRRGRYFQVAAQLARGRLSDDETVALFSAALDCFFGDADLPDAHRASSMRAFADLEAFLRGRQDLTGVERAYRTMIRRLPAGASELPDLWARLGALYRDELRRPTAAIEAYENAASLDGDRATRHRVLVDLYEGFAPDKIDKLISRRVRLLRDAPTAGENYRALAALHGRAGRKDEAFLALRALSALGVADDSERAEVTRLEANRPSWPRGSAARHATRLRHADEDVRLTTILSLTTEAIAGELAVRPRRLGLRDDSSPEWQRLRDLYRAVGELVGVPAPQLYVCPQLDADVMLVNLVIAGRPAPVMVAGRQVVAAPQQQVVHAFARALAHVRPAYVLRPLLVEPGALDAALDATLMVGGYRGALAPSPMAYRLARAIDRNLPQPFRGHLAVRVQAIEDARESLSAARWGEAVDAACRHTALLLTGDLPLAIASLGRELPPASLRSYEARLADLLLHSVSDEHASVRAELGLAVR